MQNVVSCSFFITSFVTSCTHLTPGSERELKWGWCALWQEKRKKQQQKSYISYSHLYTCAVDFSQTCTQAAVDSASHFRVAVGDGRDWRFWFRRPERNRKTSSEVQDQTPGWKAGVWKVERKKETGFIQIVPGVLFVQGCVHMCTVYMCVCVYLNPSTTLLHRVCFRHVAWGNRGLVGSKPSRTPPQTGF